MDFFRWLDKRGFFREDLQCDPEHQVESYIAMRKDKENHFVEANEKVELEPEYIDLGLPSGTLWATCNVGANAPEECGKYLTWDEAMKLDCTLPTEDEIIELVTECSSIWTTRNGVNGCLFTGSNGKTLFLPAAGRYFNKLLFIDNLGYYWSSTLGNYPNNACHHGLNSDAFGICYLGFSSGLVGWYYGDGCCMHSVRAVKRKEGRL